MKLPPRFKSWPLPPLCRCQEVGEASLCPVVGFRLPPVKWHLLPALGALVDLEDLAACPPVPVAFPWMVLVHSYLGPPPLSFVWPLPGSGPTCLDTRHQQVELLEGSSRSLSLLWCLHGLAPAWSECLLSVVCRQCILILQDADQVSLGHLWEPSLSPGGCCFLLCAPHHPTLILISGLIS